MWVHPALTGLRTTFRIDNGYFPSVVSPLPRCIGDVLEMS
jgi:hypothetical protein